MATVDVTAASAFRPSDLYFRCPHCDASLVVKASAADANVECAQCGKLASIPRPQIQPGVTGTPTPNAAEQIAERQRHLKENESQRTEINGYINQLSIQLHRWQLRLQTLNDRHAELTRQIAELNASLPHSG